MSEWQPIETAPRDGTLFICLVSGLPYAAKFDEFGRFIWYWHTNLQDGPGYKVHNINGKKLLEEIKPASEPMLEPSGHIWVKGFDETKRTKWMPLPHE